MGSTLPQKGLFKIAKPKNVNKWQSNKKIRFGPILASFWPPETRKSPILLHFTSKRDPWTCQNFKMTHLQPIPFKFSQKSVQKTRKLVNFSKNRPKICSNLNRKIKEDHKACFLGGFSLKALHFLAQIYLCFMLKSVCLAFTFLLHKWCPEKWGTQKCQWPLVHTYLLFSTFWKMSREKSSSSFENKYVCIFQNSLLFKFLNRQTSSKQINSRSVST